MSHFWTRSAALLLLWAPGLVLAQANTGEIRLHITDVAGLGLKASVKVGSEGNFYHVNFTTDEQGYAYIKTLSFGVYLVRVDFPGFAPLTRTFDVRSAIPVEQNLRLAIAPVSTILSVQATDSLIDPYKPAATVQIGSLEIENRLSSLPGRSVQDLVNSQPGWLYEGNAVLHPRGSEYQTQFVVDGMPLTDNRSPGFGPEIEAADIGSLSIYTAGIPAEYGRKMGGIVELNTRREMAPGPHGELVLSGGSYDTAASYGGLQERWGRNTLGLSAAGNTTSHYLNPVVPQNYTNTGTAGDFSTRYERDLNDNDRLSLNVRHEFSRYLIPNEIVQQQAGQVQNGDNFETLGTVSVQHIFSINSLGTLSGMVRDNANNLYSNQDSTPIIAFQHNHFLEGYFKGTFSRHFRNQEYKAGIEADSTFLHEDFNYAITNPDQFDDDTPATLSFLAQRPDLEQSAFFEDLIRVNNWTVSAGARWDHYQLLLHRNAFSPRLAVSRFLPASNMVLHASYDRVFQTPSLENILISSSPQIDALSNRFLRLPVQPSTGNYYEGGLSKGFSDQLRFDANVYRRDVNNYADDDQLLNTGVSYPIAFDKSVIYGIEGKLELVRLAGLTGFVSYSYMVGNVWFPATGGLFLGDDAGNAASQLSGHFPDSQDQRNTVRTRFQYQLASHIWLATGASYGSGLPFAFTGSRTDALLTYGPDVISRINFKRGRVLPLLAINATMGVDLYHSKAAKVRIQADGDNLNDRLNVIDFGGLFSGNAIAPARSYALRLSTTF